VAPNVRVVSGAFEIAKRRSAWPRRITTALNEPP
jgi:hypothetical protein